MFIYKYFLYVLFFLSFSPITGMAENHTEITLECNPQSVYRYRHDGKPGREILLYIRGNDIKGQVSVQVSAGKKKETTTYSITESDSTQLSLLLPEGTGTVSAEKVSITLQKDNVKLKQEFTVEPMRYWNIYLYNHSHVDIGYTNTHKNIETLHKNNIIEGIKLAEETKHFPRGSQFVWNPEITWPIERLWLSNPEMQEKMIKAISQNQLCVDASYLNLNTSTCSDEELFHIFDFSRQLQKLSGQPADVFQQFDIPGISWGLVTVMAQEGVKYIISWPNSDRAGNANDGINGFPFWWIGPDGTSRVLFFQPGKYANSGSMTKGGDTGRPWFGQRDPRKVPLVIKTGHADVDFTKTLENLEKNKYPYDFCVLSWSLWDNNPLDADVPYAVKEWNEKYAYPKIIISGGHEIMSMIETRYGDQLPVVRGDYTEYWTDGLGTAAKFTAMNRNAKEKLLQAETLWSMLFKGKASPREEFDETWRYIALGSEHTWCFENPSEPFFQDAIWKVKQSYFHEAETRSSALFDEALAPVTDKSNGALGPPQGPSNGGVAVFNTHSWPHTGSVILSENESRVGDKVVDSNGNDVPSQRLSTGELVFLASDVPPMGSAHYRVVSGKSSFETGCSINGTTLDNGVIKVTIDPKSGNIVSLNRQGSDYNYIDSKVDKGANSFSWLPANIDAPEADSVISVLVIEKGALVVELRIDSKAKGCRSVSRSVRLTYGQPWVEISNIVDKLPLIEKDGIHFGFGFNIPDSRTRVDIPWGIMEIEKDQWKQANRNWLAMQRWLDVSNNTHGVTWCSLDAPLFEYGGRYANISLSWGDKGNWLKYLNTSSTIYSWVMNNHWHTNFPLTQEGPVTFRYRILPHDGYSAVTANRFGLEQSQPLVHVTADKNPKIESLIETDNSNVYITILKSTDKDNDLIVRLRSLSDKDETVNLLYHHTYPKKASICRLEDEPGEIVNGSIPMKPYGQVTLKLEY